MAAASAAAADIPLTSKEHLYKVLVIGEFGVGEYFVSYSLHFLGHFLWIMSAAKTPPRPLRIFTHSFSELCSCWLSGLRARVKLQCTMVQTAMYNGSNCNVQWLKLQCTMVLALSLRVATITSFVILLLLCGVCVPCHRPLGLTERWTGQIQFSR